MGKKRRVWWIVGSFVLLLLAFGTVASMVGPQPERLHREVQAVARDYGFVEVQRPMPLIHPAEGYFEYEFYEAKGLDESDIERIAERLDSACNGCDQLQAAQTRGGMTWIPSASEQMWLNVSVKRRFERDHVDNNLVSVVSMDLMMHRTLRPSLWERIKGLWPW